jgi:hypothetical protein
LVMTGEAKETPAERAARILNEECATLERTADIANRKHASALSPAEDTMERWQRGTPKAEPPREINWSARIAAAIAAERKRTDARIEAAISAERERTDKRIADGLAGLAEAVGEARAGTADDLERATRSLTVEIRELRAAVAELHVLTASEKSAPVDLPRLPPTRELN